MRVQPLQQSSTSRHKLAALLALITPGWASADEAENVLRSGGKPSASQMTPQEAGQREVRAVDHIDLLPLPDELLGPMNTSVWPPRVEATSTRQPLSVVDNADGWIPRSVRSTVASPLLVDPLAKGAVSDKPAQGVMDQVAPMLRGPVLVGPADQQRADQTRVGDGLVASGANAGDVKPGIKIGDSASSILKIVPNVLEPVPRSVNVEPEPEMQAGSTAEEGPSGAEGSSETSDRIAVLNKPRKAFVDNPEQNEPSGEMTAEEIAHADTKPIVESEGVIPELSEVETGENGDDMPLETEPLEPLPAATEPLEPTVAPMEIRKLRLKDDTLEPDNSSDSAISREQRQLSSGNGDPISLKPLDPSIAKMRVGDVEPRPLSEYEAPGASELAEPPSRSVNAAANNPIQGDTITSAGELILASGRHESSITVKSHTMRLKPMIERALKYYWDRPEDAAERTHWGMMHSIMVFDRDTQIISRRQRFSAVAWMAGNNPCRNQTLFTRDQFGIQPKTGVGLQGHQAQLLAVFGLINVPLNYPVYASKQKFTVNDILKREMHDCKVDTELTFTLIGLAHYADSDTSWVAGDGQDWSVSRVIQEELAQPIVGAACGGTHRLMGLGHALRRRRAEGKPIDGQWERADRYINDFVNYTWSLQNRDGSMSTAWYEKPEDNGDIDRKIQTTGHMLEMLLTVTPDADLQSPQMLRTVNFMATTLYTERGHEWQIGPKGHALRSLAMYYQRVFGNPTPWRPGNGSRSAGAAPVRSVR